MPEIGQFFGKDHSTVMHAVSKVTEQLGRDTDLTAAVSTLRQQLQDVEGEEYRA